MLRFAPLRPVLLACAAVLAAALPGRAADEAAMDGFVGRALTAFIRPAFADLARDTATLGASTEALCAAPGEDALKAAQGAFAVVVRDWGRVSWLNLSPMVEDSRQERFFFWPDPRGIALRQVQAALAGADPALTDPAALPGKSVALQGLGALEFLLYGTGAETLAGPDGAYRCGFAAAIGKNLETLAGAMAAGFAEDSAFVANLRQPGPDNPLFRTHAEAAGKLFVGAAAGVEIVSDRILGTGLGDRPQDAKPRSAPLWRSDATLAYAAAMLAGIDALLAGGRMSETLPSDQSWMEASLHYELGGAISGLAAIGMPFTEASADTAGRSRLIAVSTRIGNVKALFDAYTQGALGLGLGFNGLDGD